MIGSVFSLLWAVQPSIGAQPVVRYTVGIVEGESYAYVLAENQSTGLLALNLRTDQFKVTVRRAVVKTPDVLEIELPQRKSGSVSLITETSNSGGAMQIGGGAWRLLGPSEKILILVPLNKRRSDGVGNGYVVEVTYTFFDSERLLKLLDVVRETTYEKFVRAGLPVVSSFEARGGSVLRLVSPNVSE